MEHPTMALMRALDYAARRHADQRRKGVGAKPYINHLAEVAHLLADATGGEDTNLVVAGLLHDAIEDTGATRAEIAEAFGEDVATLVAAVTDDKALPKSERKRLQIETAPTKPERSRLLKIADKTSNLRDIAADPPADWPPERKNDYIEWAASVVAGCRGVSPVLERQFEDAKAAAVRSLETQP
ncbi:MAG TPA: HD domain-containing protein [Alphaproteobacteria bacterium]|nr:HD domain-containing protein [Alphaproteobacteria bacterium]